MAAERIASRLLKPLASVYAAGAGWRRRWYERHPERRQKLRQPVISVGNLSVGGMGKTPVVAELARRLLEQGERPAILTRGYGRRVSSRGVTVVSDGTKILTGVDRAGDEPFMLARALPGVAVLVGARRFLSGRLAEDRFGITVHLLDDGFQHLQLHRDVDILVAGADDLTDLTLPAGRLRESRSAARSADAALVDEENREAAMRIGQALGVSTVFRIVRQLGSPRRLDGSQPGAVDSSAPVFAVAGIARPERFFVRLASSGWVLAGTMAFRDHHWFTAQDVERFTSAARAAGAAAILTTEKDAVRLSGAVQSNPPIAVIPLMLKIEPREPFDAWLRDRLAAARR